MRATGRLLIPQSMKHQEDQWLKRWMAERKGLSPFDPKGLRNMASRPQYRGEVYQSSGSASSRCCSRFCQPTAAAARSASAGYAPEELLRPRTGGGDARERRMPTGKKISPRQRRNSDTVKALAAPLPARERELMPGERVWSHFARLSVNLSPEARPRGELAPRKAASAQASGRRPRHCVRGRSVDWRSLDFADPVDSRELGKLTRRSRRANSQQSARCRSHVSFWHLTRFALIAELRTRVSAMLT